MARDAGGDDLALGLVGGESHLGELFGPAHARVLHQHGVDLAALGFEMGGDGRLAGSAHFLLYVLPLALVISGYLISTADGRSVEVFGWFEVPATLHGLEGQEDIAGDVHFALAMALLAVVALVTVPGSILLIKAIGGRAGPRFVEQWRHTGAVNGQAEEVFTGHAIVKSFGQHRKVEERFAEDNDKGVFVQGSAGACVPAIVDALSSE